MAWQLETFSGLVPRLPGMRLHPGYATIANDVKLVRGALEAWRTPKLVHPVAGAKTAYQWGCCWYTWDKCVEVAPWVADCQRLFITGDKAYPTVRVLNDDCTYKESRLGVITPLGRPSVSALAPVLPASVAVAWQQPVSLENRAYLYTYENSLGEESGPSTPSGEVQMDDGAAATISGFDAPPAEWDVQTINIYRRVTGFRTGFEKEQVHVTDFFLVGQIPVGQAVFIDTAANFAAIGRALGTREVQPPPADMRGITAVFNGASLCGFAGNKLYFSLNSQPWNWPDSQTITLDDNIVSIRELDGTLFVMTDGHPYEVVADAGCNDRACRKVHRHTYPMPMITCCSDRGSAATPIGVFYVTSRGVAHSSSHKQPSLITAPWFTTDDWKRIKPETIRLGWYDGALYIVSDTVAYVLFLDDGTFGKGDSYRLTTLSAKPTYLLTGRNGEFFMLGAEGVSQWDAGDSYLPYTWQSRVEETSGYGYFGAARVWGEGSVSMTLLASSRAVAARTMFAGEVARLPRYGHHITHGLRFEGIHPVYGVELATTRWDLAKTL